MNYLSIKNQHSRDTNFYLVLSVLLAFFFTMSGFLEITKNDLTYPKTLLMGYPPYFIVALGIAKIAGAVVLLAPVGRWLKEWVFAGFTFDIIFAFISGIAINSKADYIKAIIALLIVLYTYSLFHKIYRKS